MDKGDLSSALGVVAGMLGAAASWLAGLGIVTILFSVVIGSLLTYWVQTKSQRSAWKREAALQRVDTVYGPIYDQLNEISEWLSKKDAPYFYNSTEVGKVTWQDIRFGYKFWLIDQTLRTDLEGFFERYKKFGNDLSKVPNTVDGKLLAHLREAFGKDVQAANYQVTGFYENGITFFSNQMFLTWPILAEEHPLQFTLKQYPNISNAELTLNLQRQASMIPYFGRDLPNEEASKKFDELVAQTITEVKEDSSIIEVRKERKYLFESANSLKTKLRTKIEDPWNI